MAEVKRAYRRLAKAFHPDSAGEAALPRFLAIHEAYEAIKTGRPTGATPCRPPPRSRPRRHRPPSHGAPTRRGPVRRGSARGRRGAAAPVRGSAARGTVGWSEPPARRTGAAARGRQGVRRPPARRPPRRDPQGDPGSTSYDEARDPADATWSGASWYGPTSGEYWIVNPRDTRIRASTAPNTSRARARWPAIRRSRGPARTRRRPWRRRRRGRARDGRRQGWTGRIGGWRSPRAPPGVDPGRGRSPSRAGPAPTARRSLRKRRDRRALRRASATAAAWDATRARCPRRHTPVASADRRCHPRPGSAVQPTTRCDG